jgi:hypothetical protein
MIKIKEEVEVDLATPHHHHILNHHILINIQNHQEIKRINIEVEEVQVHQVNHHKKEEKERINIVREMVEDTV